MDSPYLAHQAQYTVGFVDNGVFFDSYKSKRFELYPNYKKDRIEKWANATQEEKLDREEYQQQLWMIMKVLPKLGYKNIFHQSGYEADDVIASICRNLSSNDRAVIVSSDKDLYQLLSKRVSMQKAKGEMYTEKDLSKDYFGLEQEQWHVVKAIAGCETDSIEGVKGIGDILAAKFLRGLVKEGSKTYQKIEQGE